MERIQVLKKRLSISDELSTNVKDTVESEKTLPKSKNVNEALMDTSLKKLIRDYETLRKHGTKQQLRKLLTRFVSYEEYLEQRIQLEEQHKIWKEFYDIQEDMRETNPKDSLQELVHVSVKLLSAMKKEEISVEKVFFIESLADKILTEHIPLGSEADKLYEQLLNAGGIGTSDPSLETIEKMHKKMKKLQAKIQ